MCTGGSQNRADGVQRPAAKLELQLDFDIYDGGAVGRSRR